MSKYVLSDVNALVTRSAVNPDEFQQWQREGRHWISNDSLPGLGQPQAPSTDEVYSAWAKNAGTTEPGYAGLIVDEFPCDVDRTYYTPWTEAVVRLHETPSFAKRMYYAWCNELFSEEPSLALCRRVMELGYRFSWEVYLYEPPWEEAAQAMFGRRLRTPFEHWRAATPGIEAHMIVCLGYLSVPPESLNLNPGVDYQVFLDRQFEYLANEPTFFGV